MPGLYVRHAVVVSIGLHFTGFGWVLPDIEGSRVSVNYLAMKSLRVVSFVSLGFVLLNIEGGGVFIIHLSRGSLRVYSFTGG